MDRPVPVAEGTLAKTPFAHVLVYVRERTLTGTLAVQGEGPSLDLHGETLVTVQDGQLAQVRLPRRSDPIGSVLMEMGCINEAQLATALARGGRVGEALVSIGACQTADIHRALDVQAERRVLRLFALRTAPYQFFDGVDLIDEAAGDRMPVELLRVLWRGIQTHADTKFVEATLTRVAQQPLRWKGTVEQVEMLGLAPSDAPMIEKLRAGLCDPATLIGAFVDTSRAQKLLYTLLIAKLAEPASRMSLTGDSTLRTRPYVGEASLRAAPPAEQAPQTSRAGAAAVRPTPAARTEPVADPPAHAQRFAEATQRLTAMDDETYFQMLGVAPSDGADTVRSAFLAQAGRWHPDRVPPDAPRLRDACAKIFALLSEAEQTLSDERLAPRYLSSVQDGGGTPAAQRRIAAMLEAATDIQKAEIHVKRREFVEAERVARRALTVAPDDASALTVLAMVLMEKQGDAALDEAHSVLQRVITAVPRADRARVLMGALLRRRGLMDESLAQFRAALEANPKNVDAQREVRLAEMRARPGGAGRSDGILSKWLKR